MYIPDRWSTNQFTFSYLNCTFTKWRYRFTKQLKYNLIPISQLPKLNDSIIWSDIFGFYVRKKMYERIRTALCKLTLTIIWEVHSIPFHKWKMITSQQSTNSYKNTFLHTWQFQIETKHYSSHNYFDCIIVRTFVNGGACTCWVEGVSTFNEIMNNVEPCPQLEFTDIALWMNFELSQSISLH